MESPVAQNSKKRGFPGGGSSYNDPDVVEIAQPTNWISNSKSKSLKPTNWISNSKSKSLKWKEVTNDQVIYIDSDDEACISNKVKPAKMSHNNTDKPKAVDVEHINLVNNDASLQSHNDASGNGSSHFLGGKLISSSSSSVRTHVAISPDKILGANGAENPVETLTALQLFKQFDTVDDHSDHHYSQNGSSQQPKNWAKRIQEEWKILEKSLPDTIFVRVYESRMDLLRAAIVGAQGTPYHDGLFFFDVFFPSGYPSIPPHVYYHSGGLRINPNLYTCGKVCLSLLNTWNGSGNEKWIPNVSTMLQVLVSIQALILNEKPYFNEPGSAETAAGERHSKQYSENTFLLSLKTMVYTMRKPPMHFKEIVFWHFFKHAQKILGACEAYIEKGVPVGSIMIGEVQNGKTKGRKKKCSKTFMKGVASHLTMAVEAFMQIGVKDCDKFLALAEKGN